MLENFNNLNPEKPQVGDFSADKFMGKIIK
jgi:hypothetical protein